MIVRCLVVLAAALVASTALAEESVVQAQELSGDTLAIYDVNKDGAVTLSDVQIVVSHVGRTDQPASDINADGTVTLSDALAVLPHVGELVALPPLPSPWTGVNHWALASSSDVHADCGDPSEASLDEKLALLKDAGVDVVPAYQAFAIDGDHQRNDSAPVEAGVVAVAAVGIE